MRLFDPRSLKSRLNRRSFLGFLGDSVLWGVGAGLAYATVRFFLPDRSDDEVTQVELPQAASSIPTGGSLLFAFGRRPALLIRDADGGFRAFLATCTHLNCTVNYDPERVQIVCPCHQGLFDLDGNVVGGPPPKPLERLSVEVDDNVIHVFLS